MRVGLLVRAEGTAVLEPGRRLAEAVGFRPAAGVPFFDAAAVDFFWGAFFCCSTASAGSAQQRKAMTRAKYLWRKLLLYQ